MVMGAMRLSPSQFFLNGDTYSKIQSMAEVSNAAPNIKYLQGTIVDYKIAFDANKWTLKQGKLDNEDAEFEITHKSGDLVTFVLAESLGNISTDDLADIAKENALGVMSDAHIESDEVKEIDGKAFVDVRMQGKIDGRPYLYVGRLYSGDEGTVQFVVITYPNVFAKYSGDVEQLLDGITIYCRGVYEKKRETLRVEGVFCCTGLVI